MGPYQSNNNIKGVYGLSCQELVYSWNILNYKTCSDRRLWHNFAFCYEFAQNALSMDYESIIHFNPQF